jgi:hypothetical protein
LAGWFEFDLESGDPVDPVRLASCPALEWIAEEAVFAAATDGVYRFDALTGRAWPVADAGLPAQVSYSPSQGSWKPRRWG